MIISDSKSNMNRIILPLIFLLLSMCPLPGQQVFFKHYTTRDGLANNFVSSLLQDRAGYLWMGTLNGLSRFDGKRFVTFGRKQGLGDTEILSLIEGKDGKIWVTTRMEIGYIEGDLYHTVLRDSTFQSYRRKPITFTADGSLCFATTRGISFLRQPGELPVSMNLELPTYKVQSLFTGSDGKIFIGTTSGLCIIDDGKIVQEFTGRGKDTHILHINEPGDGQIYIGTWGGLFRYANDSLEMVYPLTEFKESIRAVVFDSLNSRIWFGGSNTGLFCLADGEIVKYTMENGLPSNTVHSLLVDRENNLWIGTSEGATVFSDECLNYFPTMGGPETDYIVSMMRDTTGTLILRTAGNSFYRIVPGSDPPLQPLDTAINLTKLSNITGFLKPLNPGSSLLAQQITVDTPLPAASLQGEVYPNPTFDLFQGPGDTLFLIETRKHTYRKRALQVINNQISLLVPDHGSIPSYHTFKYYVCLAATSWGSVLLGGEYGLWYLDSLDIRLMDDPLGLGIRTVRQIVEGPDHTLWILTDIGVYCLSPEDNFCLNERYPELHTFEGQYLFGDTEGNMWLTGENSIACYNGKSLQIYNTPINIGRATCCAQDRQGYLWIVTERGLLRFNLRSLVGHGTPTGIVIESVSVSGRQVDISKDGQVFPWDRNSIIIDYAGLYFSSWKSLTYKVELNDGTRDWVRETTERRFSFDNLQPGNYTFKVSAKLHTGHWLTPPARFSFTITPPLWKNPWVHAGGITLFLLVIATLHRLRTYHLKKDRKRLEHMVRQKTSSLIELNENLENMVSERTSQLQESREKYRHLLEIIPVGIFTTDTSGEVRMINQLFSSMLGYSPGDVVGKHYETLFDTPRKTVSFIERKLKEVGILRGFETIMTTSGNTTVKVLLNAESMELGDISLREFAITDITKIKQLEEKLRQAERMAALGEMASSFAHGIRNPLTGLMLNFEMLSSGDDLSDEIRQRVMFQMHQGIKKLDSLLREVLSFSNPRQPVMSLIDINESISDSIVLIEPRLQQNRIKLHKELAPGPLFVTMDRDQMENVWLNLLSNAIEAMDNQGTLKVRTMRTDNNSVDVVIKDTGLGIKASQLDKIFEPFYSNKRGGTGLGLAISKKILDSHECGISVRSTSGKGTSFTISFPSSGNRTSLGASEPSV